MSGSRLCLVPNIDDVDMEEPKRKEPNSSTAPIPPSQADMFEATPKRSVDNGGGKLPRLR